MPGGIQILVSGVERPTVARIRRKVGNLMGMDVLSLHTVGRKTAAPRDIDCLVRRHHDGLVVAFGGRSQPDFETRWPLLNLRLSSYQRPFRRF